MALTHNHLSLESPTVVGVTQLLPQQGGYLNSPARILGTVQDGHPEERGEEERTPGHSGRQASFIALQDSTWQLVKVMDKINSILF